MVLGSDVKMIVINYENNFFMVYKLMYIVY